MSAISMNDVWFGISVMLIIAGISLLVWYIWRVEVLLKEILSSHQTKEADLANSYKVIQKMAQRPVRAGYKTHQKNGLVLYVNKDL